MKWAKEAENAIKRVPFFVKKKVRSRVEQVAAENGRKVVMLSDVKTTKNRFLKNMESDIKGYQLDACFGSGGCPNRTMESDQLTEQIETVLKQEDLIGFLKQSVTGDLKYHHEFRVTLSDCPNACSQPQIKDIGIIGAHKPHITEESCTMCEACMSECKEKAITMKNDEIEIDFDKCLYCGKCIQVCPTMTIASGEKGYRIQLGGKLGRHPHLARELPGLFSSQEVLEIVKTCVRFYKENSRNGQRFGEIIEATDLFERLSRTAPKSNEMV